MIAICTKIGYKIFVTLIGSNKSINTKYSGPGLSFNYDRISTLLHVVI